MAGAIIKTVADVLVLVVLFGISIFVHELGHFLVALRCGLVVETFSIGFGPALWKKRVKGVLYKIGCIPIGGYVALPQLDPSAMEAVQGKRGAGAGDDTKAQADPGESGGSRPSLPPVAPWKKILVSVSGAAGNVLLAVLLAWIVYLSPESGQQDAGTTVGYVATNSPAYAAGLRPGDEITAVGDKPVSTWQEFGVECLLSVGASNDVMLTARSDGQLKTVRVPMEENHMGIQAVAGVQQAMDCVVGKVLKGGSADQAGLQLHDIIRTCDGVPVLGARHFIDLVADRAGEPLELVVERDGEQARYTVVPRYDDRLDRALIGVEVSNGMTVMPWMQYKRPLAQLRNDAMQIVRILRALVTPRTAGRAAEGLGGPVMIIMMLWASIKISLINAVGFLRFLNVNLAILNLLPIPVLDGGHIMFALWEAVTRRRVNPRLVNLLINIFAALFILALLCLTRMDVLRLFGRSGPSEGKQESEAPALVSKAVPGKAAAAGEANVEPEQEASGTE